MGVFCVGFVCFVFFLYFCIPTNKKYKKIQKKMQKKYKKIQKNTKLPKPLAPTPRPRCSFRIQKNTKKYKKCNGRFCIFFVFFVFLQTTNTKNTKHTETPSYTENFKKAPVTPALLKNAMHGYSLALFVMMWNGTTPPCNITCANSRSFGDILASGVCAEHIMLRFKKAKSNRWQVHS